MVYQAGDRAGERAAGDMQGDAAGFAGRAAGQALWLDAYAVGVRTAGAAADNGQRAAETGRPQGQRKLKELAYEIAAGDGARAYDTVTAADKGQAVGKYGLTAESIEGWLSDIRCNPPDASSLQRAVEKGKLSADLAQSLGSEQFRALLAKLKRGGRLEPGELADALPGKLQERIMGDLVYKFAAYSTDNSGNVDVDKVLLAIRLGHVPTAAERSQAPLSASSLLARCELEFEPLTWFDVSGQEKIRRQEEIRQSEARLVTDEMVRQLLRCARASAESRNTVGWCYAGVADALDQIGVHLSGMSAYMAADQLAADGRFKEVGMSQLQPGDVLVHGASASHENGHIAVYLGDGQEASDHIQGLITGQGYGGTRVFRLRTAA